MTIADEIKQKADIVETMSHYGVKLERMGRNLKALCPFHSEKHGSFLVFPDQQRWHCFGACATGGDVISFVMKREGVDFGQAIGILAERTGVKLSSAGAQEEALRDRLFKINASAADFFHRSLTASPSGEKAKSYLFKRGLTDSSISAFQLGFSPDSWDALKANLLSLGYPEKELIDAGLVIERDGGGTYDRFRNRLIFPIRDIQGRINGFGGRALDDSNPKYLNSPQSAVFDKSSILYGINLARSFLKTEDRAVIVEGYMDVIMAHQHGFQNVVASMGTALTDRQMNILKKLTRRMALALDSDAAGAEATLRGIHVIDNALDEENEARGGNITHSGAESELSIVVLPPGKDPDEVILEDASAWRTLIDTALPAMDYVISIASSRVDLKQLQGRISLVNQVLPSISAIREPVKRAHYLQKLAHMSNASPQDLLQRVSEMKAAKAKHPKHTGADTRTVLELPFKRDSGIQEFCLAYLLQNPELKPHCEDLRLDYFPDSAMREIADQWLRSSDTVSMRKDLNPALADTLEMLLAKTLPPTNPGQKQHVLLDCIHKLRESYLRDRQAREADSLKDMDSAETGSDLKRLEQHGNAVPQQLHEVFRQPRGKQRLRHPRAP